MLVNGRFMARRITGVERYAREILSRLGGETRVVRSESWYEGMRGHMWEQVVLPKHITGDQILWSPANSGPLWVENQVLTLHDISPLEHPEWFKPAFGLWYRCFIPHLVRRVRMVAVPSKFVQKKLIRLFGLPAERVAVIPGGVDTDRFRPSAFSTINLPAKYALFVGTLQARKNILRLLDAWKLVKNTVTDAWLIIVGSGGRAFQPLNVDPVERVKFLGYVSDVELPEIYSRAALFILPSLDEGFGLPILEAMACGTLVAASNAGALPELVGNAGLTFDPFDVPGMAKMLRYGFEERGLGESLRTEGMMRARGFSWQNSAQKMREVFKHCR